MFPVFSRSYVMINSPVIQSRDSNASVRSGSSFNSIYFTPSIENYRAKSAPELGQSSLSLFSSKRSSVRIAQKSRAAFQKVLTDYAGDDAVSASSVTSNYSAHEETRLNSAQLLIQILEDPNATQNFYEFAKGQHCEENYLFYTEVREFQRLSRPIELRQKAIIIMNKFIGVEGEFELNIDAKIRRSVEAKFEHDIMSDTLSNSFFDSLQVYIVGLMASDTLLKFINTSK